MNQTRIHSLTLENFKAFQRQEFVLKGRHALIYGNNGSGKSSIYWALYTLIESAYKDPAQLAKYFVEYDATNTNTFESLRNRYGVSTDAFVRVHWKGPRIRGSSEGDSEIGLTMPAGPDAALAEANVASDFVTYRLFQHFNGSNRLDVNVWPAFVRDILPYHKAFSRTNGSTIPLDFMSILPVLQSLHGTMTQATAELTRLRKPRAAGDSYEQQQRRIARTHAAARATTDFNSQWTAFENSLSDLIAAVERETNAYLTTQANLPAASLPLMQIKLEYNQGFKQGLLLSLAQEDPDRWGTILRGLPPETLAIRLGVVMHEGGVARTEYRPQTYLNEARLTRLAFAMRVGALMVRAQAAGSAFNILCFDDVLISLDMSNRLEMLDWLFTATISIPDPTDPLGQRKLAVPLLDYYQVIFLTHEKSLFTLFQQYLKKFAAGSGWCVWELYGDAKHGREQPHLITQQSTAWKKAQAYFAQRNYTACANSLRSYCESVIKQCLPPEKVFKLSGNGEMKPRTLDELLTGLEEHLTDHLGRAAFQLSPLADLFMFKDILLNPLSHDNANTTVFADELNRLLTRVMPDLTDISREQRVGDGSSPPFEVTISGQDTRVPARQHEFRFELRKPWYMFSFPQGIAKASDPPAKLIGHEIDGQVQMLSIATDWKPLYGLYEQLCIANSISPRALNDIIPART